MMRDAFAVVIRSKIFKKKGAQQTRWKISKNWIRVLVLFLQSKTHGTPWYD
jgi:hypothetical protein